MAVWAPRVGDEEPELLLLLDADGVGWLHDNDDEVGFAKLEGLVTKGGALEYRAVVLIGGLPTPLMEDIGLGPGPEKKNKPEPEPGPEKRYVPEEDDGDEWLLLRLFELLGLLALLKFGPDPLTPLMNGC